MYVGRLAPSPTGALHLGNARTFLIAWLRCRAAGGRMLMRMEDLDHPRRKAGAAELAAEDLRWLGLDWEEGPDVGGPNAPYVQSERVERYLEAFDRLVAAGSVYPCTCTRKDVESAQSAPHPGEEMSYPGTCRDRYASLAEAQAVAGDRPVAWRFRVADDETAFIDHFRGEERSRLAGGSGDFVVARGRSPGYQLAVIVDDAAMGVTEVVRADDLVPSTHRQLVLFRALRLAPPEFLHVPLVIGADGRRLAKRHGDTRVATYREAGVAPEELVGWLAATCRLARPGERCTPSQLLEGFTLERIPRHPVVVDQGGDGIALPSYRLR